MVFYNFIWLKNVLVQDNKIKLFCSDIAYSPKVVFFIFQFGEFISNLIIDI